MKHAAALGLLPHEISGLLLRADKEHSAPGAHRLAHGLASGFDLADRLLQVNDVDAVALGEDIGPHFGVPTPGLVPEVGSRFQQIADSEVSHDRS